MNGDNKRVLVVEDEAPIRTMLRRALEQEGFRVAEAGTVAAAREQIAEARPDLILLDWMLPGVSGVAFAQELKANPALADIPLVMVTARTEEEDKVRALNLGADDYVTKPFSFPELTARMRAVLRRATPGGARERLEAGGLLVEPASQRVSVGGAEVRLGPTEYKLLLFLISRPDRVFTREQVLDRVWGQGVYVEERTVDVHIRRLRKALEPFGCDRLVQTVRGSGYRFSATVAPEPM
jgi:two-component system, OmpR family, phosphate regulon response regulator PhoB